MNENLFAPRFFCPACKKCDAWILGDCDTKEEHKTTHDTVNIDWYCAYCTHHIIVDWEAVAWRSDAE